MSPAGKGGSGSGDPGRRPATTGRLGGSKPGRVTKRGAAGGRGKAGHGGAAARPGPRAAGRPGTRPAPSARAKDIRPPAASSSRIRWLALAVIAVVLAITLAPTARSLMRQRAEIAGLQDQVVQQQQDLDALRAENERWADPAYVEQQARKRLKFVKVGDRSYTVLDPEEVEGKLPAGATVAAPDAGADASWYGRMWQSARLADQPTSGLVPVPAG
ncbi:MAG TPA: septum formation initiator family protein [Ornithinibacter sp.]|nr:septum formation initiator family protein [Ornithinibacter sp.]